MADVFNPIPSNNVPGYKGIVYGPSGRLILPGKLLGRQEVTNFLGTAAAAYTPPASFTATGDFTYVDPAVDLPRLNMRTDTTSGSKTTLVTTTGVTMSLFKAIRIDLEAFGFTSDTPKVNLRVGAFSSAGVVTGLFQKVTDENYSLTSGGETNRTLGDTLSFLAPRASQRQQVSVLIVPGTKEVFLFEDDILRLWRAAPASWTDGLVNLGVQVENTAAAASTLRFASMTVSYYA
jgi:hypothetical protein